MRQRYRYAWALTLLVAATIGCSLFSGVTERVNGLQATAKKAGTDIQEGRALISTGQAVATKIEGNPILRTAQAVATQQVPKLLETGKAFATQQGPGLQQTIEAAVTQEGPGAIATIQALATAVRSSVGQAPEDIPLLDNRSTIFTSTNLVSYQTPTSLAEVVDFYQSQMPLNGWTKDENSSSQYGNTATLYYQKANRLASLTISINPLDNHTIVYITVKEQ